MPADAELAAIADELGAILSRFKNYEIEDGDEATFRQIVVEAKSIIDQELGITSPFAFALARAANEAISNMYGTPSQAGVRDSLAAVRAAVNGIRRKTAAPNASGPATPPYVDARRLAEVRAAPKHKWDLSRLEQLCVELNVAHANQCHMSVAMLVRAITDHVAPVFGCKTFGEVANNQPGDQSFKKSMRHLNESLRSIADNMLHVQIRQQESLPTARQVDFHPDLDRLLEEVVRRVRLP